MTKTESMVVRVARAIEDANSNSTGMTFRELTHHMARAAIEAMRVADAENWREWTWQEGSRIPLSKGQKVQIRDRDDGKIRDLCVGSMLWCDYVEDRAFTHYRTI